MVVTNLGNVLVGIKEVLAVVGLTKLSNLAHELKSEKKNDTGEIVERC